MHQNQEKLFHTIEHGFQVVHIDPKFIIAHCYPSFWLRHRHPYSGRIQLVVAMVHGLPKLPKLNEHAMVGDPPPINLLDDGASS